MPRTIPVAIGAMAEGTTTLMVVTNFEAPTPSAPNAIPEEPA